MKLRRLGLVGCALTLAAASPSSVFASEVLNNPGFETGTLSPWYPQFLGVEFQQRTDWHIISDDVHSGQYAAEDSGNIRLRQDFTPVSTNSIQEISFWLRHPNNTFVPSEIDFYYSDNSFRSFLVTAVSSSWEFFDVTSRLDPGKLLTGFEVTGFDQQQRFVDITRVDDLTIRSGNSVVPEPSIWMAMLLGFAVLGTSIRRRRSALRPF